MARGTADARGRAEGKGWGHGKLFSEPELKFVRDNPRMAVREISERLRRPRSSVYNVRRKIQGEGQGEQYAVREPGQYVHVLAHILVEDWECMEIWCRWNGYATYAVLSKDRMGYVAVLCTAK